MELTPLSISGAWVAKSPLWTDERGFFREWFRRADVFSATGIDFEVQQANISSSMRGVLRGIHYSLVANGQAKWITCVNGKIRDVVVDIRPGSATYGQYEIVELSGLAGNAVLIGAGLGHGFISLSDASVVAYLVSSAYSPNQEFEINPMDSTIQIDWGLPLDEIILSSKDQLAPSLAERAAAGKLPT
jgi:dTDP-4-dehydrorhamnose 3,5-epimerase